MRHKNLRLGSITLLFTVVVLCVAALCALTAATAHADAAVAGRYAEQVDRYYETECAGQEWLADIDGLIAEYGETLSQDKLPEGTTLADGQITAQLETGNGRYLRVTLRLTGEEDRYTIVQWQNEAEWQEDDDMGSLFTGTMPK